MSEGNGILGGIEKIFLLLAIGIIGYIAWKNGGLNVVERTEEVKIIEKPGAEWREEDLQKFVKRKQAKKEQVDLMLRNFAREFSGANKAEESFDWQHLDLSEDEIRYYRQAEERGASLATSLEKASDWYNFLQSSHKTYTTLKSMFSQMTGKPGEEIHEADLSLLLDNEKDAQDVYDKIEQLFHIPQTEIASFARSGQKALSDWAEFIEGKNSKQR